MKRGRKSKGSSAPEKWAPRRTLFGITEIYLTREDIREAAQLTRVSDDQLIGKLAAELETIAKRYWEQRHDGERPRADWYRTNVGKIQKQAEKLLSAVRDAPGTALGQLRFRTEQHMGRRLRVERTAWLIAAAGVLGSDTALAPQPPA